MKICPLQVTASIENGWTDLANFLKKLFNIPNEVFTERKIGKFGKN